MQLIILGAGGYGRTVADIARQSGRYSEIHFLDDNSTDTLVIGKCADYRISFLPVLRYIPLLVTTMGGFNG